MTRDDSDEAALLARIKEATAAVLPGVIEKRHRIHGRPELAFAEHETAALVGESLSEVGIEHETAVGRTGVVGLVRGGAGQGADGPVIGIRADMDCLPVGEASGLPFASQVEGQSHACGHDLHTAVLIGTGLVLNSLRDLLPGSVKLVFQPAEETLEGAKAMLEDGVLESPSVDCMIGFHCSPELEPGMIGYFDGSSMASKDDFVIEIIGSAGHAAHPHLSVDCVLAAAEFVTQIQAVVSRELAPSTPAVISVTGLNAGPLPSTLPGSARLEGAMRTTDPKAREHCRAAIRRFLEGLKVSHRIDYRLELVPKAPVLTNDAKVLGALVQAAEGTLGPDRITRMPGPSLGSEDFAYFAERVPSGHLRIGVCGGTDFAPLHSPRFVAQDAAIGPAIEAIAAGAARLLRRRA